MKNPDSRIRQQLIDEFVPRLRELAERRRPTVRLMQAILLLPLVCVSVVFLVVALIHRNIAWSVTLMVVMVSFAAVCFAYLGKLQACDEQFAIIHFYICLGDTERLFKAIGRLGCFSKFRGILKDLRGILNECKRFPTDE